MIGEARPDFVAGLRQAGYGLPLSPKVLLIWPLLGQALRQGYSNIPNAMQINRTCEDNEDFTYTNTVQW